MQIKHYDYNQSVQLNLESSEVLVVKTASTVDKAKPVGLSWVFTINAMRNTIVLV